MDKCQEGKCGGVINEPEYFNGVVHNFQALRPMPPILRPRPKALSRPGSASIAAAVAAGTAAVAANSEEKVAACFGCFIAKCTASKRLQNSSPNRHCLKSLATYAGEWPMPQPHAPRTSRVCPCRAPTRKTQRILSSVLSSVEGGVPGSPRKLQKATDSPRKPQEDPGSPRAPQEALGSFWKPHRRAQEAPGAPGGVRRPQEPQWDASPSASTPWTSYTNN